MKSFLQSLIVLSCNAILFGQTQLDHEKKSYVNEKSEFFVQETMPIYLFASTGKNPESAHRLTSLRQSEFANPMYLDGHGVHYIRHLDYHHDIPEREVAFEIYADVITPVSRLIFKGAKGYILAETIFYGSGLNVSLEAIDEMSGVEHTYLSLDNARYLPYAGGANILKEGKYNVSVYSVDNVGNVEKPKKQAFVVDLSPPITILEYTGPQIKIGSETVYGPTGKIKLNATDNLSGIANTVYGFSNGTDKSYKGKELMLSQLDEGRDTIGFSTTDNVGNVENQINTAFFLDKTPPKISINIQGDSYQSGKKVFVSDRARISLSESDNKAGTETIKYSILGKPYKKYDGPFPITENTYLCVYGIDKVGNKGNGKSDMMIYHLDDSAPVVDNKYIGPKFFTRDTMFIGEKTKIKLTSWDSESGVLGMKYKIDGNPLKQYV